MPPYLVLRGAEAVSPNSGQATVVVPRILGASGEEVWGDKGGRTGVPEDLLGIRL